jgi:hypothetical protein
MASSKGHELIYPNRGGELNATKGGVNTGNQPPRFRNAARVHADQPQQPASGAT